MADQILTLRITLIAPPAGVAYSLQKDDLPWANVLSDGVDVTFEVPVRFVEDAKGARYLGPFVKNQGADGSSISGWEPQQANITPPGPVAARSGWTISRWTWPARRRQAAAR